MKDLILVLTLIISGIAGHWLAGRIGRAIDRNFEDRQQAETEMNPDEAAGCAAGRQAGTGMPVPVHVKLESDPCGFPDRSRVPGAFDCPFCGDPGLCPYLRRGQKTPEE